MIKHFADLAVEPEPYADYRPVFETSRLNVTHVRIHPGETVPAHTHLDEDQVYLRRLGRRASWCSTACGRRSRPAAAS